MNNTQPDYSENTGRIAFVQAQWHSDIVGQARRGFELGLQELGGNPDRIDDFTVPGAFELPLRCKQLVSSGDYALVIAAGLVVDGGIYRHEFVAQAVINGLMQVQLESDTPVLSVVLTPKDFQASPEHVSFFTEHFVTKGREAAAAVAALRQEWFRQSPAKAVSAV